MALAVLRQSGATQPLLFVKCWGPPTGGQEFAERVMSYMIRCNLRLQHPCMLFLVLVTRPMKGGRRCACGPLYLPCPYMYVQVRGGAGLYRYVFVRLWACGGFAQSYGA